MQHFVRLKARGWRGGIANTASRILVDPAEFKPDVDVFAAYDGLWRGLNSRRFNGSSGCE